MAKKNSKRQKINFDKINENVEMTPIDMSKYWEDVKTLAEIQAEKEKKERDKEKARIDMLMCPVCKSTKKTIITNKENNGILGSGFRSWMVNEYILCLNCGVHYSDLTKFKK